MICLAALACGACLMVNGPNAAAAPWPPITQQRDFKISNTSNTVPLTIQKPGTQTNDLVQAYEGSNLKFSLPASGMVPVAYGGTGTNTAAGARANLGIPETSTNSVLPVAAGGTGTNTADGVRGVLGLLSWTTNTPTGARTALGIQAGVCTTSADGGVTNTFSPVFTGVPFVTTAVSNVFTNFHLALFTVTSNSVVFTSSVAGVKFNWIAVGSP